MATEQTTTQSIDMNEFLNNLASRLRLLEERYQQLRETIELVNENLVEERKNLIKETRNLNIELKNLKKDLIEVSETINHIVKEVKLFARKDSLKVLEKYINMWNPLHFTTEDDVKRLIKEELKKVAEGGE
ncbi:MAG: hypothetical protein HYS32_01640 [Candidatus Woesearchaeota archaeon]|nr:MAG: hypothetical protein HYS32_01640 [Candidatus Woesearchaeota archaeon]